MGKQRYEICRHENTGELVAKIFPVSGPTYYLREDQLAHRIEAIEDRLNDGKAALEMLHQALEDMLQRALEDLEAAESKSQAVEKEYTIEPALTFPGKVVVFTRKGRVQRLGQRAITEEIQRAQETIGFLQQALKDLKKAERPEPRFELDQDLLIKKPGGVKHKMTVRDRLYCSDGHWMYYLALTPEIAHWYSEQEILDMLVESEPRFEVGDIITVNTASMGYGGVSQYRVTHVQDNPKGYWYLGYRHETPAYWVESIDGERTSLWEEREILHMLAEPEPKFRVGDVLKLGGGYSGYWEVLAVEHDDDPLYQLRISKNSFPMRESVLLKKLRRHLREVER